MPPPLCAQEVANEANAAGMIADEEDGVPHTRAPTPTLPRALTTQVYTAAMGVCARCGRVAAAEKLLGYMKEDGLRPTAVTYATLVHACAQAGDWRRALELLDLSEAEAANDGKADTQLAGELNSQLARCDAAELVGETTAAAVLPDAVGAISSALYAYGGALRACAKAGEHGEVLNLFDRIKANGLVPNAYCYHQAILACEHAGSLKVVFELIDEMKPNGVPPNIYCYTAAVQVCAARGSFNAALNLVDRMCSDGPKPTAVTYNVLLRGAVNAAQNGMENGLETAAKVLEQMPKLGAKPDGYSYSMVINAFALAGRPDEALKWLKRMPKEFVSPMTYQGLISALCEAGLAPVAMQQLAAMRKAGHAPTARTTRLLLDEFGADDFGD